MRKRDGIVAVDRVEVLREAEQFVIKSTQRAAFEEELLSLKCGEKILSNSEIIQLTPFLDGDGILRVGGRIRRSPVENTLKKPIILPMKCHVAALLTRHLHEKVQHQGRTITEASIRSHGYWVIGGKRLVSSIIHACVTCRKLRGKFQQQQMAELPADRVSALYLCWC